MAKMCQVNDEDKLKASLLKLSGDVLKLYLSNIQGCSIYDNGVSALCQYYNSSDNQVIILTKWQFIRLIEEMMSAPDSLEVEVIRTFVAKLTSLQKQMDKSYSDDKFLRKRLVTDVYIPYIQIAIRDSILWTSQQLVSRITDRPSKSQKKPAYPRLITPNLQRSRTSIM